MCHEIKSCIADSELFPNARIWDQISPGIHYYGYIIISQPYTGLK